MSEQEIDSELKGLLDLLRPVPQRKSDAMHQSRSRFYADLDAFFPDGAFYRGSVPAPAQKVAPAPQVVPASRPVVRTERRRPWYYRPVFAYIALTLVVLIAMVSGGFVTALAAGSALPGDALYPLKLDVEQARISLTSSPERQAELYLEFAQNRLSEMNTLAGLGQFNELAPLASQFNYNVSMALENTARVTTRDPDRALRLQIQARNTFGLLEQTAALVLSKAPPALQPALQAALDQAGQVNTPGVNPNANGNQGSGNGNPNRNPGNGNPNPGNPQPNPNANANPNPNNGNSNSNSSPGSVVNGNSNDNSNANPGNANNNGKSNDKNNNGKNDDKNNNGKNDDKNNNGKNDK